MSTEAKRILVFTDWFLPGYRAGGPIRSLANLVSALPHQFFIVTSNKDHHHDEPYENVISNEWTKHSDNTQVIYLSDDNISATTFQHVAREVEADKIYFNSLFSPRFTISPLRALRKMKLQNSIVLAPRGMLKPGALSVKSRKKKIFLLLAKITGLYNGIRWHATNADEVNEIKHLFSRANDIVLAPNLPSSPKEKSEKPIKQSNTLRLICIARISPEKGILEAIKYLGAAQLSGEVICDFYGTQQNEEYLNACIDEASKNDKVKISFKGEIAPEKITEAFHKYHFFYMTTWGENFGHAIAEALNSATPVLISNKTPWQGLEEKHAGWALSLDATAFAKQLNNMLSMENEEYKIWSDGAYKLGHETAHDPWLIEASIKLFE